MRNLSIVFKRLSVSIIGYFVVGLTGLTEAQANYLPIFPGGPDLSCFAKLESPGTKTRKATIERKAHKRLGPNLTILFHAPYFDGVGSVEAHIAIYDAQTEQPIKTLSSTVSAGWKLSATELTNFGLVSILCR